MGEGHTVQLIDAEGNVTRSVDEAAFDPETAWRQQRLLWARHEGDVLVARAFSLTLDVYTADLIRRGSITRVAAPVPLREPEGRPSDGVFDEPFTPRLTAIWEDERGQLWLQLMVPSPTWKPVRRSGDLDRDDYLSLASRPRIDNLIEVVDVEGRRVLARSRFSGSIGYPFGGGFYATPIEDSSGEPSLRITRMKLKQ
jgi:hypothetical protein